MYFDHVTLSILFAEIAVGVPVNIDGVFVIVNTIVYLDYCITQQGKNVNGLSIPLLNGDLENFTFT